MDSDLSSRFFVKIVLFISQDNTKSSVTQTAEQPSFWYTEEIKCRCLYFLVGIGLDHRVIQLIVPNSFGIFFASAEDVC